MENSIQELTELQQSFGYGTNNINPVALLGLFGEAGEVLNEVALIIHEPYSSEILKQTAVIKQTAVNIAQIVDTLKKSIRDTTDIAPVLVFTDDENKFKEELADCLYYLNILANSVGASLEDLAEISINKVKAKSKRQHDR